MSRASDIVDKLLEAEEDFDPREYLLSAQAPLIRISYDSYTPGPEDDDEGEEDHGWIDEEGVSMEPDQFDREEGLTSVDLAVKFLNDAGAGQPSSGQWHPGIWYMDYGNEDMHTGERVTKHYHLVNFDEEDQKKIFNEVALKI